jgi:uncharacterized protein DUF2617
VRTRITTRYAESRAADLRLVYGLAPLPALGTHTVQLHGVDVELRLLGASHQVIMGAWTETLACLDDARAGALPSTAEGVEGGLRVQFSAHTLRLAQVTLAERVVDIVNDYARDSHALVGDFPGSPFAVTALRAWEEKEGMAWRTWHSYPQVGELVETFTVVKPI